MYRYCLCCSSISSPLLRSSYLEGSTPNCSMKCLRNVLGSLNPTISDISKTEYLCSMISEAALLILILRITLIIESSLRSLIFLYKVGCDIFNRSASICTLKSSLARLASMTLITFCMKSSPSVSCAVCFNINDFV